MTAFGRWLAITILALGALTACAPAPQAAAPTADPGMFVRRLATVMLPPTPDDTQRRATQIAARPSATFRAPTLAITPTVYVGTFAGVEADEPSLPVVDPAQFLGTLGAPTPVAPGLAACSLPVDPLFGTGWSAEPGMADPLGCPESALEQASGSGQAFEHGVMLFLPPGEIWAIQTGGAAGAPYWHTAQAPADRPWDAPAPDGLRVPVLGFGGLWKANAALREALGHARADEAGGPVAVQRFEGGVLLREGSSGAVFVLIGSPDSGVAFGPF